MAKKISEKSDDIWSFRCYAPSGAGSGVDGWYSSLSAGVRAEIDACLELLRQQSPWGEPEFKSLRNSACKGLDEIRIDIVVEDENEDGGEREEHYRILGFRGPKRGEFTLLLGFLKSKTSDYGAACHKAQARKESVLKDGKRAPPCTFP